MWGLSGRCLGCLDSVWGSLDYVEECPGDILGCIDVIWIGNSWIRVIISSIVFCSNALQCTNSLYLGVSGWGLRVLGRCLGVFRCHINWKLLNKSHNIKTLPFLPVTFHRQKGAKWSFQTFHWARGFFWGQVADFWTKWLVLVHYKVLGGWHCQILISPIYQYTLAWGI